MSAKMNRREQMLTNKLNSSGIQVRGIQHSLPLNISKESAALEEKTHGFPEGKWIVAVVEILIPLDNDEFDKTFSHFKS